MGIFAKTDIPAGDKLAGVAQRRITVSEILLYATLPFLLVMCGAMPVSAPVLLPFVLALLYLLYRRFGAYLSLSCIVCYGVLALTLNYDILSVVFSVALLFAFVGLVLSVQATHYLACVTIAVVFAVMGALAGAGIVRLAEGVPMGDIAANYVTAERDDPIISYLARDYYDDEKPAAGETKLKPSDEGYADAAINSFAEWARDEFGLYIWYDCIHVGALIAVVGFFVATVINGKTKSSYDAYVTAAALKKSTRAKGGVRGGVPIADMRMPRAFLWTMALPATVAGMILGFVGGYDALSATVMHMFATLPAAFGCFTLFAYWASLFDGKARIAAHAVLVVLGVAAYVLPIVLFFISMIGICDCILNLRFWTDFIRKD